MQILNYSFLIYVPPYKEIDFWGVSELSSCEIFSHIAHRKAAARFLQTAELDTKMFSFYYRVMF